MKRLGLGFGLRHGSWFWFWASRVLTLIAIAAIPGTARGRPALPPLELHRGDRIVFVGNTFAERLTMFGDFETILLERGPGLDLSFRSLAWSGDSVTTQLRPLSFGDLNQHLTEQKPDVIVLCFGMSESFAGEAGLAAFESDLRQMIAALSAKAFNGKAPPRLVLVSPIAHERIGGKTPDPAPHNRQLREYVGVMAKTAESAKIRFVDLFAPTQELMKALEATELRLTINGIHLSALGSWIVAQVLARELGAATDPPAITIDAGGKTQVKMTAAEPYSALPSPPSAKSASGRALALPDGYAAGVKVTVRDLPPGRYALKINGELAAIKDQAEWARGAIISAGAAQVQADRLRDAVKERNQQFYHRYRAVNGEYIYGRRKEPFGVENFPSEMRALDRITSELDQLTWYLSKPREARTWELTPAPANGETSK